MPGFVATFFWEQSQVDWIYKNFQKVNKTSASPKNNLRIYKLESISNKNVSDVDTV